MLMSEIKDQKFSKSGLLGSWEQGSDFRDPIAQSPSGLEGLLTILATPAGI